MVDVEKIKCSRCHGACERIGDNEYRCTFCGSSFTVKNSVTSDEVRRLNAANEAREEYNFPKALELCAELKNNEEAAWCALLSEYTVVYTQNDEKIFVPTFLQVDAKKPPMQSSARFVLLSEKRKREVEVIERRRQEVIAQEKAIESYDVFICYKQHEDADGRETIESKWANSLYHALDKNGLRVFYDEESLKGSNVGWEPQIYAAIKSAKFMVVIASSLEHINARWVKNEWKRFLWHKRNADADKTIAVLGHNIDPYVLPDSAMRESQMVFATDGNWESILLERARDACARVPSLERREYGNKTYSKKTAVKSQIVKREFGSFTKTTVSASEKSFLLSAKQCMELGDFDTALDFCNTVLAKNKSNSEAYWLAFLCENKSKDKEALCDSKDSVRGFDNLHSAIASGNEQQQDFYYQAIYDCAAEKCELTLFEEYVSLPESSDETISELAGIYYQRANELILAGASLGTQYFDAVIKTVENADKYVQMNIDFGRLAIISHPSKAIGYMRNALAVDEGNADALYYVFILEKDIFKQEKLKAYLFNTVNRAEIEKLYAYGFNEMATQAFYETCLKADESETDACAEFFDFLLSLIPQNKNKLFSEYLGGFVDFLIQKGKFACAQRFNDILIGTDKLEHNAYFNRVLLKNKFSKPYMLMSVVDNLTADEDYRAATLAYAEKHTNKNNIYIIITRNLKSLKNVFNNITDDMAKADLQITKEELTTENDDSFNIIIDNIWRALNKIRPFYMLSKLLPKPDDGRARHINTVKYVEDEKFYQLYELQSMAKKHFNSYYKDVKGMTYDGFGKRLETVDKQDDDYFKGYSETFAISLKQLIKCVTVDWNKFNGANLLTFANVTLWCQNSIKFNRSFAEALSNVEGQDIRQDVADFLKAYRLGIDFTEDEVKKIKAELAEEKKINDAEYNEEHKDELNKGKRLSVGSSVFTFVAVAAMCLAFVVPIWVALIINAVESLIFSLVFRERELTFEKFHTVNILSSVLFSFAVMVGFSFYFGIINGFSIASMVTFAVFTIIAIIISANSLLEKDNALRSCQIVPLGNVGGFLIGLLLMGFSASGFMKIVSLIVGLAYSVILFAIRYKQCN